MSAVEAPVKRKMSWFAKAMIASAVLLPAAGAVGYFASNGASSPEQLDVEAQWACEGAVGQNLKAPSTAKYSSSVTGGEAGGWIVTGTVDAENSFGAQIRSSYSCTVVKEGDRMVATLTGLR